MLRFHTARGSYRGPNVIDISRAGCDRARAAGKPTPGDILAPPGSLLWPAKLHLELCVSLSRRAATLPEKSEPRAAIESMAEDLLRRCEDGYTRLYRQHLLAAYGSRSGERPGPRRREFEELLALPEATLVCMCRRRVPSADQPWTCHRELAGRVLVKLGAVDLGEAEQPEPKTPPAYPLPAPGLLVAVAGCRPPKVRTPASVRLYQDILVDVRRVVQAQPRGTVVVTGGAEGVDLAAEDAARACGLATWTIPPWYAGLGPGAPMLRNAYNCVGDRGAAFPGPDSRGTWDAIRKADAGAVELYVRALG